MRNPKFKRGDKITPKEGLNTRIPQGMYVVCPEDSKASGIGREFIVFFKNGPKGDINFSTDFYRLVYPWEELESVTDDFIRFELLTVQEAEITINNFIRDYRKLESDANSPYVRGANKRRLTKFEMSRARRLKEQRLHK